MTTNNSKQARQHFIDFVEYTNYVLSRLSLKAKGSAPLNFSMMEWNHMSNTETHSHPNTNTNIQQNDIETNSFNIYKYIDSKQNVLKKNWEKKIVDF